MRVALSWSGGKDSAWALVRLGADPNIDLTGLITTVNSDSARVAVHGFGLDLLRSQAAATGLPITEIDLPEPCSNEIYRERMSTAFDALEAQGVEAVAYGDLHLADIRRFREREFATRTLDARFPLWGEPTAALAQAMLAGGLEAVVVCVDTTQLAPAFVGRDYDAAFLRDLPPAVDPCGENGEFHTFVRAGPMFRTPVAVRVAGRRAAGRFTYADLEPA